MIEWRIRCKTLEISVYSQTCVFSLGASLWSAADWLLTEAEKPSLSSSFQELLASMTNDGPDARPSLQDVLQVRKAKRFDFHLVYLVSTCPRTS